MDFDIKKVLYHTLNRIVYRMKNRRSKKNMDTKQNLQSYNSYHLFQLHTQNITNFFIEYNFLNPNQGEKTMLSFGRNHSRKDKLSHQKH